MIALDTLRVANRFPTPTSKTNDSEDHLTASEESGAVIVGRFEGFPGSAPKLTIHILNCFVRVPAHIGADLADENKIL